MCKRSLSTFIISLMLLTFTGCSNKGANDVPKVLHEAQVLTEDNSSDVVGNNAEIQLNENISIEKEDLESLGNNALNMRYILENIDEIKNNFGEIITLNETTYSVISEDLDSFVKSSSTTYTMHEIKGETTVVVKTNISGNVVESIGVEIIYDNKEQAKGIIEEILGKLDPTGTVKFKTSTDVYETDNNENLTFTGLDNKLGKNILSMNISIKSRMVYDIINIDDMWEILSDYDSILGKTSNDIKSCLIQMFAGFESETYEDDTKIDEVETETKEGEDYSTYNLNISYIKIGNGNIKSVRYDIDYNDNSITAEINDEKTIIEYNCLRRELDGINVLDNITNCIDGVSVNIYQNNNEFTAVTDEHSYIATMENYGNSNENHQIKYSISIEKK